MIMRASGVINKILKIKNTSLLEAMDKNDVV